MTAIITIGSHRLTSAAGQVLAATADNRLGSLVAPDRAILPVGHIRFAPGVFREEWIGQTCLMSMGDITGEPVLYGRVAPKLVTRTADYTEVKLYANIFNRSRAYTNPTAQPLNDLAEEIARVEAVPYLFADYLADDDVPMGSASIIEPRPVLDVLSGILFESFWDLGFIVQNNAGVYSTQAKAFTRSPDTATVPTFRDPLAWDIQHDPNPRGTICNRLILYTELATETYQDAASVVEQGAQERQIDLSYLSGDESAAWAARYLARFSQQQIYIRASFARFVEVGALFKASFEQGIVQLAPHHAAGASGDIYQVRAASYDLVRGVSTVLVWRVWDDPADQAAIRADVTGPPRTPPPEEQTCYFAATTAVRAALPPLPAQSWLENTNVNYRPPLCSDIPEQPTLDTPYIWSLTRQFSLNPHTATAWDYVEVVDELGTFKPSFGSALYEFKEDVGIVQIVLPEADYTGADTLAYYVSFPGDASWLSFDTATRTIEGAASLEQVRAEPYVFDYTVRTIPTTQGEEPQTATTRVALTVVPMIHHVPPPSSIFVLPTDITNTSMVVRWGAPDEQDAQYDEIDGYEVHYTIQGNDDWSIQVVSGASMRHAALSGLQPCQPYQIKVKSIASENAHERHIEDSAFVATTATTTGICRDALTAPTNLRVDFYRGFFSGRGANSRLTLSWDRPLPANVQVTNYVIALFASPHATTPLRELGREIATSTDLAIFLGTSLVNAGGTWTVAVKAISGLPDTYRDSGWSQPLQVNALPRTPTEGTSVFREKPRLPDILAGGVDAITEVSARLAGTLSTDLRLPANAPSFAGRAEYQIVPASQTGWDNPKIIREIVPVEERNVHATPSELSPGTEYKWRVRAAAIPTGDKRESNWSNGSNFTTLGTAPTRTAVPVAGGLTGTPGAANSQRATLSWSWNTSLSGADGLGGFLLRYWRTSAGKSTATTVDLPPSTRSLGSDGLDGFGGLYMDPGERSP